jgi:non-homologous end joining protein Ku
MYRGFIEPEVAGPVWFMPWLAKLAPNWTGLNALIRATDETLALFRKMVNERRKTWKPTELNDFVDAYLLEMENTKDPNSSFYKEEGSKADIEKKKISSIN